MKKHILNFSAVFALLMLLSVSGYGMASRVISGFNKNWTFHLGEIPEAFSPGYKDNSWRKLNLPHDWAIEGEFSKDNPSGCGGGALPGGVGWYRKTFTLDPINKGKKYLLILMVYIWMPKCGLTVLRWENVLMVTSLSGMT
jgi:Glycosyl hydrolases family 2, sugar binding domain.